ncbi:zinc finger protein 771 isoform X2 [Nothobranchius furzeri]|uniref:Transcript variant X2 n=1 Tax=Nothobranchius furzeri TaxID=105023 RepID=A0A9D3BSB8_NOTFU|nr:zinc finger protein 771 isoform X2 [Nothobranchius furzeri]KAF7220747.1 transcript variant X2 [Nothobranchius furzeri]
MWRQQLQDATVALSCLRENNEQQNTIPEINPRDGLRRLDVQQMVLIKEEAPEEWRLDVDQEEPDPIHIKKEEEEEEIWTSLEGEPANVKVEMDDTELMCSAVPLSTGDNEERTRIHNQGLFACDFCGQRFTKRILLSKHMIIHTEPKVFGCDVCGQKFGRKENLNRHIIIHTGDRPFACDFCGQKFTQKTNLKKHMRVHTGERPFACDFCGQKFAQKTTANKHMETHTGQKRFDCDTCGQRFTQKASLVKHKRIHTGEKPFSCDVCSHRFTQKASLVKHKRIHTGEKPFPCEECGQKFARKTTLVTHQRIHTGEKPFACDVCTRRFNQRGHLNAHMKSHTDVQVVLIEEVPENRGPEVDQQDPELLHIKEEEEKPRSSPEGEQLSGKETDTTRLSFTVAPLKSEDDEEKSMLSQLHHQQMEEGSFQANSTAHQMKAEAVEEDSREVETTMKSDLKAPEHESDSSETDVSEGEEEVEDVNIPESAQALTVWARN